MRGFYEWRKADGEQRIAVTIPARHDYHWEREQQLVAQRRLRERLRYKGYVMRGTLSDFMQRLGDFGRRYGLYLAGLRMWR